MPKEPRRSARVRAGAERRDREALARRMQVALDKTVADAHASFRRHAREQLSATAEALALVARIKDTGFDIRMQCDLQVYLAKRPTSASTP